MDHILLDALDAVCKKLEGAPHEKVRFEETRLLLRNDASLPQRELNGINVSITPYVCDEERISLQFWGWCINLMPDGTWFWEDTSGG